MRVAAIVVAAGEGERFGERKQFSDVRGRTAAARAIDAARSVAGEVVLVAPPDATAESHGADRVVAGATTRSGSVRAGLAAIDPASEVILVHDAARPLASPALFAAVLAAVVDDDVAGAIPGVAVSTP